MNGAQARDVAAELRAWARAILQGSERARRAVVQTDANTMLAVSEYLDAYADAEKAAGRSPAQPATVEQRCGGCRFYTERANSSDLAVCKRYPQHICRHKDDWCGEFAQSEVQP